MKRLIMLLLAVAGIAITVGTAILVIVSAPLTDADIADYLSAWTGEHATVRGEPAITFVPSPAVEVRGVTVGSGARSEGEPWMSISSVRASLDVGGLLVGRRDIRTLTLVDPNIRLGDRQGVGPGRRAGGYAAAFRGLDAPGLDEIVVHDGVIEYGPPGEGRSVVIESLKLRLDRRDGPRSVVLSGTFEWRDAKVKIRAGLDDVRSFLDGPGSSGRLKVAVVPAALPGYGGLHGDSSEHDSGSGDRSIRSLIRLAQWLAKPITPESTLGPLRVAGTFEAGPDSLTVSDAKLELHGDEADGALTMRLGSRPLVEGSLAFEELDLGPYVERWSRAALAEHFAGLTSSGWLSRADIGLTASAERVDLGNAALTGVSIAWLARAGGTALVLGGAGVADGRMQGQLVIEPGAPGPTADLSACLIGVSAADVVRLVRRAAPAPFIGAHGSLAGTGALRMDLSVANDPDGSFIESLSGVIAADIHDGVVTGIDIPSTLERLVDGGQVIAAGRAPFIPVTGRTEFESLSTYVEIDAGVARAGRIRLDGERYRVALSGEGRLARGEVEANGVASLFDSGQQDQEAVRRPIVRLPFGVGGMVSRPMIVPGIPRVEHQSRMETDIPLAYLASPFVASGLASSGLSDAEIAGDRNGTRGGTYVHCGFDSAL